MVSTSPYASGYHCPLREIDNSEMSDNERLRNINAGDSVDQVNLRQLETGVELRVKASPNSRQNDCRGVIDGALKISVTAVAEKGKANAAIIKFLSKQLRIPKGRIRLASGTTSSLKKLVIRGMTVSQLDDLLAELIRSG
ncbi:MAG: hypothetical protein ACI87E_005317, partial [Mariniblastus sp.]